jgi:hypothetical protein
MACCGQNRERARTVTPASPWPSSPSAAPTSVITPGAAAPLTGAITRLRYTGMASIVVRGPRTGRSYAFSAHAPEQTFDRRDADAFLRMALFRRV